MMTQRSGMERGKEAQEENDIYIHTYNYGWFVLLYGRNQHKIVKHFSTPIKKKKRIHLAMQGMQVQSLVEELGSHMPQGN